MGQLVDGVWEDVWYDTKKSGGKFVRSTAKFRNWITPDGSAGPSGEGGFPAEAGRYHLYVSLACPWAHRTLIFRKLKKLTQREVSEQIGLRQATISSVESGDSGTQLKTLTEMLKALELELVIKERSKDDQSTLEDLF